MVALDLGGIAKGLYVDALVAQLSGPFPVGIVSAGGDLRVWGRPASAHPWEIGVEDPQEPERDLGRLRIRRGAVATSGTSRRTWRRGTHELHHLIDPNTGQPATSGLRAVTVLAGTAAWADVVATALVVGGLDHPAAARLLHTVAGVVAVPNNNDPLVLRPRGDDHNGPNASRRDRLAAS
jgi:thiamine biosynthesis lipoprotein